MSIGHGLVTVTTAAAQIICTSNQPVLMQNIGANPVTIGGPGVTVGHGVTLPANMTSPISVPCVGGSGTPLGVPIYGTASGGSSNVVFLTATWDG
jgi:hypothetical protein